MGTSENKQIVTEFFSHSSAGRRPQAIELLTEDATWWAPGVGVMSKPQFAQMMGYMDKILKGPVQITFKRMTAEEDRVAAEAESDADVVNGKHYHNTYHFLVVIRDGKIREVKEYNDTRYAMEVFGDLIATNR
ncbi:MAG TPA: nuclear transport factor 2 family protein [Candidatus Binataceae bacterium]